MKNNKNIILHQIKVDGSILSFKEFQPRMGDLFPQFLQIDSSGFISWINISEIKTISLVKETTKDLFEIIDEQQKRLDQITENLNEVIKLLSSK